MATTKLSDIIDVTVFRDLPPVNGPEKTAFYDSGVVTRNALLDELASSAGKIAELPFWKDLDGSVELNYSDDDPTNEATPQKVVQGEQIARKAFVNQGWQAAEVYSQMVKNDDIDFIPDSEGNLVIPTYLGLRVIVDDGMNSEAGSTDGFKFTSVLFGAGAFGFGVGNPEVPVEIERYADQGNGGGIETLWVRETYVLHPFGFKVTGTPSNGITYTLNELEGAGSVDRVIERKNIPLAFLITN